MHYFSDLINKARMSSMPQKQALAISGSPRPGGNSDIVQKHIISGLSSTNVPSQSFNLSKIDFKGCIGCERCRKDKVCTRLHDGMTLLYPEIMDAQALILTCPVHNYNITSWMKAFIDRMYCFYEFDNATRPRQWYSRLAKQNRKVVIVAVCEQDNEEDMGFALEAMQSPMKALGYDIIGSLAVFNAFEKGAIKQQDEVLKKAYELGVTLGKSL